MMTVYRWGYCWMRNGRVLVGERTHESYSDRRMIADIEIRRANPGIVADGNGLVILGREKARSYGAT